jgi:excisionase family DNA binding protein
MKTRPTQFGVRENTASSRRHASRLAVNSSSPQPAKAIELLQEEATLAPSEIGNVEVCDLPLTETNGATVGKGKKPYHLPKLADIKALNHTAMVKGFSPRSTSAVNFEPLLDVTEAAKLLRIHPKTLRTKARCGEIPGIQIGRVWRFRASALDRWLESVAGSQQTPVG